jgi:hypothetical protein
MRPLSMLVSALPLELPITCFSAPDEPSQGFDKDPKESAAQDLHSTVEQIKEARSLKRGLRDCLH